VISKYWPLIRAVLFVFGLGGTAAVVGWFGFKEQAQNIQDKAAGIERPVIQ
jgi:hypothetical protein